MLHIQAQVKSTELTAVRTKLDRLAAEAPDVEAAVFSREKAKQGDELF